MALGTGLLGSPAAVMYVEREVFGLQEEYMICKLDGKAGRFVWKKVEVFLNKDNKKSIKHYEESTDNRCRLLCR